LVPFSLLVKKLNDIGCELLNDEEAKAMKLDKGSQLFEDTYQKVKRDYPMSDAVKQFSFLNRWFIFVRKTDAKTREEAEIIDEAKATAGEVINAIEAPVSNIVEVEGVGPVMTMREAEPPKTLGDMEYSDAIEKAERIPTVPVEAIDKKKYSPNELFQFYADAAVSQDKLKTGYKDAGRWLAPYSPFPILDGKDEYSTMEHYIASMKYKYGAGRPELGLALFARDGEVHSDFLAKRLVESAGRPLSIEKDQEFLKAEAEMVKLRSSMSEMKKKKIEFNEMKWAVEKDRVLEEAIKQRMNRDAKFKKIVDAAKAQGKYLLYYTGSSGGSELGGVRRPDGSIDGDNRIGKTIMRLAGYSA
jgi:hypothetical protein